MVHDVLQKIDHTLLRPDVTVDEVGRFVEEGLNLGVLSICIAPSMVAPIVSRYPEARITAVCGFPSGQHLPAVKAAEAAFLAEQGASEIDMVISLTAAIEHRFCDIEREVRLIRDEVPGVTLKTIMESAVLDDAALTNACSAAVAGGADYVKTSTGFHPAGGATLHAVRIMAEAVAGRAKVKASGGIRNLRQAQELLAAGADRLGVSRTRDLLAGAELATAGY